MNLFPRVSRILANVKSATCTQADLSESAFNILMPIHKCVGLCSDFSKISLLNVEFRIYTIQEFKFKISNNQIILVETKIFRCSRKRQRIKNIATVS